VATMGSALNTNNASRFNLNASALGYHNHNHQIQSDSYIHAQSGPVFSCTSPTNPTSLLNNQLYSLAPTTATNNNNNNNNNNQRW
jgi:hypothetical protein